jgi:predicted GIY-YIG superfamily endonuclease
MSYSPKTIQIFLPSGDPRGIRTAEITTRIIQIIEVPRIALQDFLKMPESEQVALYFLFGESDDGSEKKVYIGQTGDLKTRLNDHNKKKDFWERALILISRTNSLTQTHALFLEWQSIQSARMAGRYADENGTNGSKPHTPAPLQADCLEIFETAQTLLSTLGYPIFDTIVRQSGGQQNDNFFYCKASGTNGKGMYTEEGFVVLSGSVGRLKNVNSIAGTPSARMRERLLESGVMQADGESVVFTKDELFGSPSMAAIALTGRSANGWMEWKDQNGRTLDEVKRQLSQ